MAQKLVKIGAEVEQQTDVEFSEWAVSAGRSKRRHAAILLTKLTRLFKSSRSELERLGLVEGSGPTPGRNAAEFRS